MATLTLGETPLTRIGLGTNRLRNMPENVAFVRDAVAAGIGLIDTVHTYTGGKSEQTVGVALSSSRDGCVVATKGGVIDEYRERGAIQHIGVLNVSVDQIERAIEAAPIAAVQNHYNLSERTHEDVVDYCAGLVSCRRRCAIIGLSVLVVLRLPPVLDAAEQAQAMTGESPAHGDLCAGRALLPLAAHPSAGAARRQIGSSLVGQTAGVSQFVVG
jgi:predicted aldo/keto reductase-like oxidoreductase